MIKYHGTPITPIDIFLQAVTNKNVLVSWANPQDINNAFANCNKVILDNGAFTFWKKKKAIDWNDYYQWVFKHSNCEYFFIPDVIDGTEEENDKLIEDFFRKVRFGYGYHHMYPKGIPVWHIHESFDRLEKMMTAFNYIAIGSSGEFTELGTPQWHKRMNETMKVICDSEGRPKVKIHMLRCLDPRIFTKYPFYSGDSTNLARNHNLGKDGNGIMQSQWKHILERIEKYNSPQFYKVKKYYETKSLF
jgi:hypothetical protein